MNDTSLISRSGVKTFLKQQEMRVSNGFYGALNEAIRELLIKTAKRARGNRRSTILSWDV